MRVPFLLFLWTWVPLFAENRGYEETALPLLEHYCFDCHGDGRAKGGFSMDEYAELSAHLEDKDHWIAIWKNIRSQIMPPIEEEQFDLEEKQELLGWIESEVFGNDPANPDPGRVTVRRLNRYEYHHVVEDLLGVDFSTWENFPADDTGYGFDTIGDVLNISPLHMEKYLSAAEEIAEEALPSDPEAYLPVRTVRGKQFQRVSGKEKEVDWLAFAEEEEVFAEVPVLAAGEVEVELEYRVRGARLATDQTAKVELLAGGEVIGSELLGWEQHQSVLMKGRVQAEAGPLRVAVRLTPVDPSGEGQDDQYFNVMRISVKGPFNGSRLEYPVGYRKLLTDGPAPEGMDARRKYAEKILRKLMALAFRRPVDEGTLQRLLGLVETVNATKGAKFEDGIRQAVTAILVSPQFLFRAEVQAEPNNPAKQIMLDEYALASRLSFFLWSSVPDEALLKEAEQGTLRKNLGPVVDRMLVDERGHRFTSHFVGQWLQARDIQHHPIDPWRITENMNRSEAEQLFSQRLRDDMLQETNLFFDYILKRGRPVLDLINADYSFLNGRLAKFYGVKGVDGEVHRYVDLKDHPERGGVLTQGTMLVVTSNPTRTSPVKRGLFVLDQILGTPAPPAPPGIPELEEVAKEHGKKLSVRQLMEVHRKKSECAGCHARMDPIGLGLENFNGIGQWRESEDGQKIDSAGVLVTGEKFNNVVELKKVLAEMRKEDIYRCLAEKLLTYGIGRGIEYYDSPAIDKLVRRMETGPGTLKDLVLGVIESVPFQQRRGDG